LRLFGWILISATSLIIHSVDMDLLARLLASCRWMPQLWQSMVSWDHYIYLNNTSNLAKKFRHMDWIIREATEIKFDLNNMR
jgi:hypothetical protein